MANWNVNMLTDVDFTRVVKIAWQLLRKPDRIFLAKNLVEIEIVTYFVIISNIDLWRV